MADEIADEMDDNEALRRILGEFREYRREAVGEYDSVESVSGACGVGPSNALERAANANAVRTVVVNDGADRVYVTEDGHLVGTIGSNGDDELPLMGKGAIKVYCGSGGSSTASITTFVKD